VRVIWTPQAQQDRADIWDYIAQDNPTAAAQMDQLFSNAAAILTTHPRFGKAGAIQGTRELVVHKSYRMVYEISPDTVWILVLMHTARLWPPAK
jgi:toxin ParE1/3/4